MTEQIDPTKVARLQAVRDAYWLHTKGDDGEFSVIFDSLREFCDVASPTLAQCRRVFDLLEARIIGAGVMWGFDDTEVRDDIYGFVRENAQSVQAAIALPEKS